MALLKATSNGVVEMTPEEEAEWIASLPQSTITIPQSVTMRQARLALLQAGKLADVQGAIDSLPEYQKVAAQIEWDYSSEVQRDKPLVLAIGPLLGLSPEDLDNLFITAASL